MAPSPASSEFEKHFKAGKTQLVWSWAPADLETPVSAFLKLAGNKQNCFLLESVEGGKTLGRYSAIGLDPDMVWTFERGGNDPAPLETLRGHVKDCRIDVVADEIPPMGPSGLFGYLGYDSIRLIEDIPDDNPDMLGIPEGVMIRPTIMVLFDNVQSKMCIVTPVREHAKNTSSSADEIYAEKCKVIEQVLEKLSGPIPEERLNARSHITGPLEPEMNMRREDYHGMVEKAVEYIHAGEIFQVVPSQRFTVPFDLPAIDLYRSLRRLNPSPFLFYFNFEGFSLVGSSPEILVRVRDNVVTIRPIAGTRKRGKDDTEDKALAEDLLGDPKEKAEHLMLLDLGRNDVGRVAEIGSVRVTDQFTIEHYSHVMHIVSNVEGRLRKDLDSLDALFAGFPAGTVSGAPKIRAMEIIDEIEPVRRGFYGGCVGYLDGNGDLDTCIALRTALVKDGKVIAQAGGGVVADSDPDAEYQESCNKARAIIQAAEQAIAGKRSEPL